MNSVIIWILVAVAVLGGGFLLLSSSKDSDMMEDKAAMEKNDQAMMKDEGAMMQEGSYEPYSSDKLAMATKGDVVLFFRATWCPTCKALDADIRSHLSAIPANLTILDVDYDNSATLKQKYGITYQHTLVQVNADGSQIKKWSGSPNLASLIAQVQ